MSGLFIKTDSSLSSKNPREAREEVRRQAVETIAKLEGLDRVKRELNLLLAFASIIAERKRRELKTEPMSMHMLFVGPPGTGKTEVARQVGKLLYSVGLLKRGHVVETDKSGLVGQHVGDTPKLVADKFEEARDGVLFVDEAYTLADGMYGKEAIETLMKLMEDFREDTVVIFAGYEADINKLLATNAGMESRFTRKMVFEAYGDESLVRIFNSIVVRGGYVVDQGAEKEIENKIAAMTRGGRKDPQFGNARAVRSLFEKIITNQAMRLSDSDLSSLSDKELVTIVRSDVEQVE